jgi:hypothetical protein
MNLNLVVFALPRFQFSMFLPLFSNCIDYTSSDEKICCDYGGAFSFYFIVVYISFLDCEPIFILDSHKEKILTPRNP